MTDDDSSKPRKSRRCLSCDKYAPCILIKGENDLGIWEMSRQHKCNNKDCEVSVFEVKEFWE